MAKAKQWVIKVGEATYDICFQSNKLSGKERLLINGEETKLKKTLIQTFIGLDKPLNIGGKECRFVLVGSRPDIAVDGFYISSKKPYMPLKKIPLWGWLFICACLAIPIVALGGWIPVMFGLLGASYCIRVLKSPYLKTPSKALSCVGITLGFWALFALLILAYALFVV